MTMVSLCNLWVQWINQITFKLSTEANTEAVVDQDVPFNVRRELKVNMLLQESGDHGELAWQQYT